MNFQELSNIWFMHIVYLRRVADVSSFPLVLPYKITTSPNNKRSCLDIIIYHMKQKMVMHHIYLYRVFI